MRRKPKGPPKKTVRKPMTKREVVEFISYMRKRMYLNEWSISVNPDAPPDSDPGCNAYIVISGTYLNATIYIHPVFYTRTRGHQEDILTHELSHVYVDELAEKARDLYNGKFHSPDSIQHSVERVTQRIADLIHYGLQHVPKEDK